MVRNLKASGAWLLTAALLATSTSPVLAANADDFVKFEQSNDCSECDLSGADLSGSMKNANPLKTLTDSNFENAAFTGSDIQQANFDCSNLAGAKLDGIRSRHPNFNKADLNGADLTNAMLDTPNFFNADLSDASLTGVTWGSITQEVALSGAKLCNTTMPDSTLDNSGCDGPALNRNRCVTTWR